jgi:hypothetical protein
MNRLKIFAFYITTIKLFLGVPYIFIALFELTVYPHKGWDNDAFIALSILLGAIGLSWPFSLFRNNGASTWAFVVLSMVPLCATMLLLPMRELGAWETRGIALFLPVLTVTDCILSKKLRTVPGSLSAATRVRTVGWTVFSLVILLGFAILHSSMEMLSELSSAISTADRIVVRDGGFDCCGPVDDEAVLFEVTDPAEIKEVRAHIDFTGTVYPCNCCGFPGIDWYCGKERLALTAVQHERAIRWGYEDFSLSDQSRQWLVGWLVQHGVRKAEIDGGCGGPRRGLRQEAVRIKLAQSCVSRGQAHAEKGEQDAAIADFTEAVTHEVNFAPAYYFRGLAHEKNGNLDKAITDFTEAIWFNSPDQIEHRAKGTKYVANPGEPFGLEGSIAILYARGRAYGKTGEKAKAEEDFARGKKLERKPE